MSAGEPSCCCVARLRARARRARRARRAERLGQDDAARDDPRPARGGDDPARPRRRDRLLLPAGDRARRARLRAPVRPGDDRLSRPEAQALLGRFLFSGWDAHEKPVAGALGRRAAAARARAYRRVRRELPRPRRADEPPRPREPRGARGGARRVPRDGAARLARPRAARRDRRPDARDRGRRAALVRRRLGRATAAARGARAPAAPSRRRAREAGAEAAAREAEAAPSALERSRRRSPRSEEEVAELERSSPRTGRTSTSSPPTSAARDALTALLERWEQLFEQAQAELDEPTRGSEWFRPLRAAIGAWVRLLRACRLCARGPRLARWRERQASHARFQPAAESPLSGCRSRPALARLREPERLRDPVSASTSTAARPRSDRRSSSRPSAWHSRLLQKRSKARVERDGGHVLPQPVAIRITSACSTSRSIPVAAARRAVDRDRPLVVRENGVEPAPVRAAGLDPGAPEELDHVAAAAVLAAHHGARHPPDDLAREGGGEAIASFPNAAKTRRMSAAFGCSPSRVAVRVSRRPPRRSP